MPEFAPIINLSALNGTSGFEIRGEAASDHSGWSVSGAGDVNGDGLADLIIGAFGADPHGELSGASYVVFGRADGFTADLNLSSLDGTSGFRISGVAAGDQSGFSVASAGDVNGDGFADVIVGARYADPHGQQSGASYVVFGNASGFTADFDLSELNGLNGFKISGVATKDFSGYSAASAGDVNGDGFDDVIVGAGGTDQNGSYTGTSYVVFGKAPDFAANIDLSSLNGTNGFRIGGEAAFDRSGFKVASAGDINGDGFADLIIGTLSADPNGNYSGASYVVFGKAGEFTRNLNLSTLDGSTGFQINGEAAYDFSGFSVSGAGDVNGDGFADLIVGAKGADPNGSFSGASYVVFGKASDFAANLDLSTLNGSNGFEILGEAALDQSGFSVSSAGDVNGDGFDDLLIGADRANPNGRFSSGASYVVFGKAAGFVANLNLSALNGVTGFQINGEASEDRSGSSVSSAGDVNGDGFADLIVGAAYADPNGSYSGASYVVFGHRAFAAVTRIGTGIAQTINGGKGDDSLDGRGGKDTLIGWEGDDVYTLNDVNGPASSRAFDKVVESAGAGIDTVLVTSRDDLAGADGYVLGANVERGTIAGTGDFFLDGNELSNLLTGNSASNALRGLDGNDRLKGGDGKDNLGGGLGNDILTGGLGRDVLNGGEGNDDFDFNSIAETSAGVNRDRIVGFTHLADDIDLSTVDAIAGGADTAFVFRGVRAFTAAGQVRLEQAGADTIVEINTVGTGGADATILLAGVTAGTITALDFVL